MHLCGAFFCLLSLVVLSNTQLDTSDQDSDCLVDFLLKNQLFPCKPVIPDDPAPFETICREECFTGLIEAYSVCGGAEIRELIIGGKVCVYVPTYVHYVQLNIALKWHFYPRY